MSNPSITGRRCGVAAAAFAIGLLAPYLAQADMNIVGSTHGQAYQGVANPATGQAAAAIPLSLCDPGSAERFQNLANVIDPNGPATGPNVIRIPAGNIVVWRCTVNTVPNFLFRYTGGFSAMAYANIKAPLGSPASNFTSIDLSGCTNIGVKNDPGTNRSYTSNTDCPNLVQVPANFATSDTKGSAFKPNMCDPASVPSCAQPIQDIGVTSFPITATAFSIIVGNGVQKCDPVTKAAAGKISLTRAQVEAIYDGNFHSWNQLGYCVYAVIPFNPMPADVGPGAGDMATVGTPFNPSVDQSIITCSRPTTAGTRIVYDAVFHKDTAEVSSGTVGPPFAGDIQYLAPTVNDGLTCVQGRVSPSPQSNANINAITYNRADEAAHPSQFGVGNVGRMRGGYPVAIDGVLPSDFTTPPAGEGGLQNPSDAVRAKSQKEFRCGRYAFWSDWVGIQRTTPDSNQALWNQYVTAIANLLPRTQIGYFHAKNLRQPGQPVVTEMLVQKGDTKGPITFNDGDHPTCY